MLEFDGIKKDLSELAPRVDSFGEVLRLKQSEDELKRLEKKVSEPDFWSNHEGSAKVLEQLKYLKARVEKFKKIRSELEETTELVRICDSEEDSSFVGEIKASIDNIKNELEIQILESMLSGKHDSNDALLTFHAGAGGTEAQDWVEMLYRIYHRWAERHGMRVRILDFLDGEEAGYKNISILVEGTNAYGLLKGEAGVHRLVRVSPFDSSGRRHTSFAAIEVIPEINDKIELDIPSKDIKMDVFRASGAGGQHVNKTSSAVRLTHVPTGIVVTCQNERSQIQNREMAMKTIKSKLYEIKERDRLASIEDIKGIQKEIAWGSQIRSYVFMPYTLVKDHRTGTEIGNISAVMDGEIDEFINSYLKKNIKL
ncbi:MAG: peptide chain release factor 2 [Oscillospiraceae bacterium]|jgi:peptide chain release factor 2|nr:peptide chain release factor 2 [Oscillospiraceae bacterium]